jgi:hypothetical protein
LSSDSHAHQLKSKFAKFSRTHRDGGEEGGSPSKEFEKFDYKNAIKHVNRGHPLDFLTPTRTTKKFFENNCESM